MGAPLRPCSGLRRGPRLRPAGPCSAPLRGLRRALAVCGAVRSSRPPGRAVRPSLRAPPAPVGASGLRGPLAPSGCRARAPPAGACRRPLAAVVGGGFVPPRRLGGPPVPGLGAGGGAPPRGPGLVLARAWCRPVLPTRRRGGALGPAAVWPSLLAPAPCPRGRSAAAACRQPPRCQHIRHGVQRRNGRALMIQRPAHPLDVSILRHEVNRVYLPRGVGADVLRQAKGPGSPLDILPNRLPCLMPPPR